MHFYSFCLILLCVCFFNHLCMVHEGKEKVAAVLLSSARIHSYAFATDLIIS